MDRNDKKSKEPERKKFILIMASGISFGIHLPIFKLVMWDDSKIAVYPDNNEIGFVFNDLKPSDIAIMDKLLKSYKSNRKQFEVYQDIPVPIAERIIINENSVRLLSKEKYDKSQNLFYVKELGVGYIRREEYEQAIGYYLELLDNDFLYYRYHAYKQFARILRNMEDSVEFARLYDKLK